MTSWFDSCFDDCGRSEEPFRKVVPTGRFFELHLASEQLADRERQLPKPTPKCPFLAEITSPWTPDEWIHGGGL
jgi:hypothetical protein